MTSDDDLDRRALERYFDAARATPPQASEALLARVAADAQLLMPERARALPWRWRDVFDLLGGWPAAAGLGLAACVGVWIGVAPPGDVAPWFGAEGAALDWVDPMTGFDDLWLEG